MKTLLRVRVESISKSCCRVLYTKVLAKKFMTRSELQNLWAIIKFNWNLYTGICIYLNLMNLVINFLYFIYLFFIFKSRSFPFLFVLNKFQFLSKYWISFYNYSNYRVFDCDEYINFQFIVNLLYYISILITGYMSSSR